jgi:Tfp pilus assembly protein PilF
MRPEYKTYMATLAAVLMIVVTAGDMHASLQGPGRVARKRLSSSVAQITVYDWRGMFVRQGWGFFINQDGHIITPRSLLEGGFYVEVTTASRKTFAVDKVYAEDIEGNFIRLGLEYPPERFAYLERSATLPGVGQRVLVGGGIGCEPGAFLDGYIEDMRKVPFYGSLIKIGSPFATVGSPVFNEKGVLTAVVMFRLENGNSSAWAVPVGRIAKVMAEKVKPVGHLTWAERRHEEWQRTSVGSYMTGLAYYWTGQYGVAIARLTRATRDKRFRREAFFLLGCCNDAVDQYEASIDAYTMAIHLGDGSAETYLKLATALFRMDHVQRALDIAWAAIRVEPTCYEAFILLGKINMAMGKQADALTAADIAIWIDPHRTEAYYQKGVWLRKIKKYNQAIMALRKCIDLDPRLNQAYWDLALTYYYSGDLSSATRICEALKTLDPELSRQLMTRIKP